MDEKGQKQVRGIRISTVNIIMMLISCVLYVFLITATIRISDRYQDVHGSMDDYIAFEENESFLTEGSAYLTEQVRLYTVTLEPEYMEHYFTEVNVTRRRETALEHLEAYYGGDEAYEYLVEALREGLKADIIDVIATDHAPHTAIEKGVGIRKAPFGIVGLETAAALTMTELVDKGWLTIMQMAEKMSYNPAKILGLGKGVVEEGKAADLVVFDAEKEYAIDPGQFCSRGKNTPFAGRKVKGMVMATIVGGKIAFERPREKK